MKKIFLAALTLAMTACVSNDDLNPVDNYGYIDVNVSNDPIMVTRAGGPSWLISATKDGSSYTGIVSGANKVPSGTYVITAKSHTSIDVANTLNTYGEPYFEGESAETQISVGQSENVNINCHQAQNSKLTLVNALNSSVFTNVKLNATSLNRQLSLSNQNPSAFYSIETSVNYNISYNYNGSETETVIKNGGQDYTITIAEAAKDYQIKLTSTDNGNINVTVTYNNEFGTVEREFTFDAATGDIAN